MAHTPYPAKEIWRISAKTSQESAFDQFSIRRINLLPYAASSWISIVFRVPPYPFNYPTRRLTMEEMLDKFIDEGKREHEEMEIFIKEFRTTNELLLKERSNLLSELKIEVNELSKVIGNVLIPKNKVKGMTTRGGKMTSEATPSKEINETGINKNAPRFEHDVQEEPHDVGMKNKSSSIPERTTQPLVKPQQSSISFSNRIPPTEDEEWHGIDDLDNTINIETQKLLDNDQLDPFLLKGMEKSINQSDLESCNSIGDEFDNNSNVEMSIRRIDQSIPELKDLPSHLEYAYLHGNKSFPVIVSSKLSEEEKISLLQVLEKRKGVEDLAVDHLFRIEDPHMEVLTKREIADEFPNKYLMLLKSKFNDDDPWYADFVNYIVGKIVPPNWTFEKRKRFFSQVKTYFWEEPYAFKLCADNIMRRYVAESETQYQAVIVYAEKIVHIPWGMKR
ncbi:hypothetical protein Tco_0743208 [Tanacetum coccineum]